MRVPRGLSLPVKVRIVLLMGADAPPGVWWMPQKYGVYPRGPAAVLAAPGGLGRRPTGLAQEAAAIGKACGTATNRIPFTSNNSAFLHRRACGFHPQALARRVIRPQRAGKAGTRGNGA